MTEPRAYLEFFDSNPQPMWIYDVGSLDVLAVNDAAIEQYGHSREEFLRLTVRDLRPGEDVPALMESVSRHVAEFGGRGVYRHRRKDGSLLHVDVISRRLTYEGRHACLVMAIDVTARIEAEIATQRAQALLRVAGRVARVGGWSYDPAAGHFQCSSELGAILGTEFGASTPVREVLVFIAPEWRSSLWSQLNACVATAEPFQEEIEAVTAERQRIWVRISAEAVRAGDGRVISVEGAAQNVTDERDARTWNEERLRHFLDAVPTPIWSAHPDGRADYVNKVLYDYTGSSPETLRPREWPKIIHPDDVERAVATAWEAFQAGKPYTDELRMQHRDGGYRWNLSTGSPLRDEEGRVVKYYGTIADIHDIKEAQEALRDREQRLRTIFDHVPECVKVVSADGILLDMNPAGLAMIGASTKEEAVGQPIGRLIHPDDRMDFLDMHDRTLRGESGSAVFRIVGLGGEERWAESRSAPLKSVDGRIDQYLSVTRDVTARRQAEIALTETLNRNESVLASTADGIHGLDTKGRVIFANAAAHAMLGYRKGETQGRVAHDIFHHTRASGEPYPAEECPIHQTIRDGRTRTVEDDLFFRKDGTSFPVEYTVAAMHDGDGGAITGAVVTFRDVTNAKRDKELRALEARVLDMVSARAGLTEILDEITRTVDGLIAGARSSVHLVDEDGCLRHGGGPGLPQEFNDAVEGLAIGENAGSCGTAAWRREPVVVVDTLTDPLWADYLDFVHRFEIRGSWSIPVLDADNEVLATFAVYYSRPTQPSPADESIVSRVCQFVRTAIERHGAAEALRLSELRLRTIAEHIDEVFWITTPQRDRLVYVSPAFERVWKRSCAEFHANPWLWIETIHSDDRERAAAAAKRQKDGPYAEEYRIVLPDGTVRWIADRGTQVKDADGKVVQIVGSARDITGRKEAEISLRERLKELHCLYRVSALTSDQDLPVEAICRGIVDQLGTALLHEDVAIARIQLGGREFRSAGWRTPKASLAAPIRRSTGEAGAVEIAYRAERPDAGAGHGPFLKEEFDMICSIAVHLADMMDHRDLNLKLTESERLRAIGQLTGGVAHDFNNLLTVILGNAEVLAESLVEDERLLALAETTATAAERGAELAGRLLAFARRQPLDPAATDVNQRIADMDRLLRRTLGEHVEFTIIEQADLWHAMIDAVQLENAILNLCINARDAMPDGGKLLIETDNVSIDTEFASHLGEVDPGDYVMVAVSDTGSGMDAETLRRAFEPFFTTKDVGRGSGLGLSMVYGFVKQSRGHVRIYSEAGHGTTVRLYLPRALAEGALPEAPPPQLVAGEGKEKILLVEDDDLVRDHVRDQLLSLGYHVTAVEDGPAALQTLSDGGDFDLLFTDVVMSGGMSGNELVAAAKEVRPSLPVLFTSGYTELAAELGGRLNAGTNLLQKPYRRQELAAKVRSVIDAAAGQRTGSG